MIQRLARGSRVHLIFRIVAIAALVAAFGQVTLGGVVRVTGSGLGCPDWPLCHGRLIPPFELATLIEYTHRLSASALGVLIFAATLLALLFYRRNPWILYLCLAASGLVIAAGALGGVTVITELAWWVRLFHLGIAEGVVAAMVFALVVGWRVSRSAQTAPADPRGAGEARSDAGRSRFDLLVMATVLGTFGLIIFGSYVVGYGAGFACATWPLCNGSAFPDGNLQAVHMGHRYLSVIVGALIVWTLIAAQKEAASRPDVAWAARVAGLSFALQIAAGAWMVFAGFSQETRAIHLSMATLVWIALLFLAAFAFTPKRFAATSEASLESSPGRVRGLERLTP
ncbi:MAG: COX15/CtaA family protein [Chloroflexi bacterium]|nr:COX15/CtaA family protein [Chloroflexota bacterium]